ncbi:complex I subunit 4 family protein [Pseudalkalibacillus caeni]|uniref:NADH-quinone oxidoreductase subunit M n=1 Tax=Exobacillus caeni TaxID=2574798 RepID=A0A5R9EZC8_9BACL|nr:NADH-quinone oxidoreductase subunit M [Pseudalkalibacillus caeni]TLS35819.1 NADH-quinone oxidoreductase subunit M [Pseudalkalibacillus caeni]
MNGSFLLSALVFSPLLGILVLAFVPGDEEKSLKRVGVLGTTLPLVLSFILFAMFDTDKAAVQFLEKYSWLEFKSSAQTAMDYAISYELGVTGISVMLVLLSTIVIFLASIASLSIKENWKSYFMLFLLLEVGILGVFTSENLFLFFVFFEITLIPMFFLIGNWGYYQSEKAAFHFLIYNGLGSAVLLIVFVWLFMTTGTLNINELKEVLSTAGSYQVLSEGTRTGLVIALLIAFGVKLPIFPLHSWMLKVHVEAPPPIVMIHSGILLKIGAYGLIRFGVNLFPEEVESLAFLIAVLGVINLLYGAFVAFVQTDFKRVLAYSSVSHMGIVLIGIAALNASGIQGALFQVISHGLISALLFFLIGVLYERTKTTDISTLGGLAKTMPLMAGFMLAGGLASLGLPGMSGFISEFMAFLGLFKVMPAVAAIGALGIIFTAVYVLRAVLGITFGELHDRWANVKDVGVVEMVPATVLLGLIILVGVYPAVIAQSLQAVLTSMGIGG